MKGEPLKTVPVNAAGDDVTVHLAPPGLRGKMLDGRLETLCGLIMVSQLAGLPTKPVKNRCPVCYGKVDRYGYPRDA